MKGIHLNTFLYTLCRLHREALKQAATDPKTGIIDIGILTTGVSSSERQRRETLAKEIRKILQTKAKGGATLKCSSIFDALREQSQIVGLCMSFKSTVIVVFCALGHFSAVV